MVPTHKVPAPSQVPQLWTENNVLRESSQIITSLYKFPLGRKKKKKKPKHFFIDSFWLLIINFNVKLMYSLI